MSLKEQIQVDRIQAMKDKNTEKRTVLGTLIGELDRKGKDVSDAEVIKIVKKMVENNITCGTEDENQYLEVYLPQMLIEAEIYRVVRNLIINDGYKGMKDMGRAMNHFKENYAGRYDGKQVSDIVKLLLSE